MVNIGDFARLGGVSTRMLRHYDALGLLAPAQVDAQNGHRSYDVTQLAVLNRLVALKGLGFSLQEVGVLLREGVDPAEMQGMLRLRRAELARPVQHDRHVLDRVMARLRLIEEENLMDAQIETKHADAVSLAALSATAPDASRQSTGPTVQSLFDHVCDLMDAASADRTSPVAHYIPDPGDSSSVLVTAGFVVPGGQVPDLETYPVPAAEVASIVHHGPMTGIAAAYQELARWAESKGHHKSLDSPRWRELYLEAAGEDQTEWIVEVQLELT